MFAKIFAGMQEIVKGRGSYILPPVVVIAAVMMSGVVSGETFAWKYYEATSTLPASPNWQSFGTASNWAVGTDKNGSNPNSLVPGAGDFIYYGANDSGLQAFDLDGQTYVVGGLTNGYSRWSKHLFLLRHGTLECTTDFTNRAAHVYVYDTGRFVLGPDSAMLCGQSSLAGCFSIRNGGEADIAGRIMVHALKMDVDAGGTLTFAPATLSFYQGTGDNRYPSHIVNSGVLNMPHGFALDGRTNTGKTTFLIEQRAGTLTVGDDFKMFGTSDYADFVLVGGTVNVTNDVAFVAFRTVMMTNNATATVNVSGGKTFDLSVMVFEDATSLTKTGAGTLKVGSSVPETFLVSAGTLHLTAGVALGECLTLAPGTTLHLASVGISADSIAGLADANVTLDVSAFGGGSPVFRSSNATLLATLLAKLGEAPAGFSYSIVGDTLWLKKDHAPTVFAWKTEVYYSALTPPASPNWQSFGVATNWAVGTSKTGTNPDNLVPCASDKIYYGASASDIQCFDMGGAAYTVSGLEGGDTKWNEHLILVRNGTLTFSESFTNYGAYVYVYDTGRFVLGPDCTSVSGRGGTASLWYVYDGGEMEIGGTFIFDLMHATVETGGKFTFHPDTFAFLNTANKSRGPSYLRNNGVLDIPGALTLSQRSGAPPCTFSLEQLGGTLTLGGNFASTASADYFDFILAGGTVNATNDVAFSGFRTILMTNDAVAVVNVAAGKTLDFSNMKFASGTSLTKTGAGTLKLGASVPVTLSVEAGSLAVVGAAAFGDGLSLASGTTVDIQSAGVSAGVISGIAEANVVFDASLLSGVAPLFVSSDAATLSAIRGKMGNAPSGYEYRIDGDTLVLDKPHAPSVFYWKKEGVDVNYSFFNPAYWGVGDTSTATNPDNLIPGVNDEIYYGNAYNRYMYFDMKGATRTVKALNSGLNPTENKYGFLYLALTNGTLTFTSCFTNLRAYVTTRLGGRFVLADDCFTLMGSAGAANKYTAETGGECDLGGTLQMNVFQATAKSGGRIVFRPKSFVFDSSANSSYSSSYIRNSGMLDIPSGFTLGGRSGKVPCVFAIEQNDGTLTLGGNLTMTDTADYADFVLAGGIVNATNDVSFNGFHTVMMTNDATATACVADGKTLDFSAMTFETGTALSKTGDGTLKIGTSVPQSLDVQAGTLAVAGAAAFGEGLALGDGATLHFAAGGSSADAISGLDDATVTIEPKSVGYGSAIISSTNATLIASVAEKLSPAIEAADKPKLFLEIVTQVGDPDVSILRLMRVPKGMVFSFK